MITCRYRQLVFAVHVSCNTNRRSFHENCNPRQHVPQVIFHRTRDAQLLHLLRQCPFRLFLIDNEDAILHTESQRRTRQQARQNLRHISILKFDRFTRNPGSYIRVIHQLHITLFDNLPESIIQCSGINTHRDFLCHCPRLYDKDEQQRT